MNVLYAALSVISVQMKFEGFFEITEPRGVVWRVKKQWARNGALWYTA